MRNRNNLMVAIDNRKTGDQEVILIKTTSDKTDIIIEFKDAVNKMNVNIDDLQEALDAAREFNKNRKSEPKSIKPIGLDGLSEDKQQTDLSVEFVETELSSN